MRNFFVWNVQRCSQITKVYGNELKEQQQQQQPSIKMSQERVAKGLICFPLPTITRLKLKPSRRKVKTSNNKI